MHSSNVALVIIFCITVIILVLTVSTTVLIATQFGDRNEIQTVVAP